MNSSLDAFLAGPLSVDRPEAAAARAILAGQRGLHEEAIVGRRAETSRAEFDLACALPVFGYQQEVIDAVIALQAQGRQRSMVSLPTGGGKTRTALWLFRGEVANHRVRRMLWVAPSVELVEQAVGAIRELWASIVPAPALRVRVGQIGPFHEKSAVHACATFATTHLAARRLAAIRAFKPDLLIFDEAHQAAARTARAIVRAVCEDISARVVGLSATPGRTMEDESELLSAIFGGQLIAPASLGPDPVDSLRRSGVLARVELRRIPLPAQWEHVRIRGTSTASLSVDELACNSARFWALAHAVAEVCSSRQCLFFGASIAHCVALGATLRGMGLRIAVVTNDTPPSERASAIRLFRAGGLDVLLNKNILAAGFDFPELEDVVLGTPIRSAIQWEQIVGRVSRGPAVGGTECGRVWELDDHKALHERVMASQRFRGDFW